MLAHIDIGEGTPILFIHGLGSKKEAWIPQLELVENYRLILPDLRGHGETTLSEDISIRNFASDLIRLLEDLEIPSAYICGLSLGGIVAQELYRQNPSMVKGLILANTTSYIHPLFAAGVVRNAHQSYHKSDFIEYIVDRGLYDKTTYKDEAKKAFLIRDSYLSSVTAPIGLNYFPTLMTIRKPVLLVGSSHDNVTPILNMQYMKMCLAHASTKIFSDTGHLSNIERKKEFNQLLHEFIGGHLK